MSLKSLPWISSSMDWFSRSRYRPMSHLRPHFGGPAKAFGLLFRSFRLATLGQQGQSEINLVGALVAPEQVPDFGAGHATCSGHLQSPSNGVCYRIAERVAEDLAGGFLAIVPDRQSGLQMV